MNENELDKVVGYYRTAAPDGFAAYDAKGRTKRLTDPAEIEQAKTALGDQS